MMKIILTISLIVSSSGPLFAQSLETLTEIRSDTPVNIRGDRAYFLFNSNAGVSPVFLRIPTEAEMEAYDSAKRQAFANAEPQLLAERQSAIGRRDAAQSAGKGIDVQIPPVPTIENFNFVYDKVLNVHTVNMGRSFAKIGDQKVMLIEAKPGNYVLYGIGYREFIYNCFCLGTVSFAAKAGEVTNLGTLLVASASERSDYPELSGETGFGPSMNGHSVTWTAAIRPADGSIAPPQLIPASSVHPAEYRAVGKFVSGISLGINRLAPLKGILGYDKGDVIDLVSHTVAANQY